MLEYDKESLIRLVAKQADFTISDTRIIFETLEDCIYNIVKNGDKLKWHRIMKLYVKNVDAYNGWNPIDKKHMVVPAHKRVYMTPSKVMHNFINELDNTEVEDEINE